MGAYALLRVASVLVSVALAFEHVVDENPLPRDTGLVWHPGYHSYPAQVFSVCSLWCYQCVSSHPGCGLYDFDWRYHWSHYCEDSNNKCVKLIEGKGVDVKVTRDCLSNLEGHRRDIPADRYEGCRPAAKDPLLGQYIFPSIVEIDHKSFHHSYLFPRSFHRSSLFPRSFHRSYLFPRSFHRSSLFPRSFHRSYLFPRSFHRSYLFPRSFHRSSLFPRSFHHSSLFPRSFHRSYLFPRSFHRSSLFPRSFHRSYLFPRSFHRSYLFPVASIARPSSPVASILVPLPP
ncbi:hypothetical protein GWK47_037819 [Chionoecetes opilio]|uniref:Uncharacterized protein n=1 Tax=Chionoecetes opilio TaxID=41210 RepID=A0A8J5CMF2_CHIOP|nr:hypothetical protein GWK47_037819 [Chionoecetes opilio]